MTTNILLNRFIIVSFYGREQKVVVPARTPVTNRNNLQCLRIKFGSRFPVRAAIPRRD